MPRIVVTSPHYSSFPSCIAATQTQSKSFCYSFQDSSEDDYCAWNNCDPPWIFNKVLKITPCPFCVCVCVCPGEGGKVCVWLQMGKTPVENFVESNTLSVGCFVAAWHQSECMLTMGGAQRRRSRRRSKATLGRRAASGVRTGLMLPRKEGHSGGAASSRQARLQRSR